MVVSAALPNHELELDLNPSRLVFVGDHKTTLAVYDQRGEQSRVGELVVIADDQAEVQWPHLFEQARPASV